MRGELTGIDLRADEHKKVVRLLQHHLPDTEVWAYGSRVKGTARPASDLDLVAFASAGQKEAVSRLREAFDESPLPFRVDLFVWDKVPEEFRKNIEEARVVVQKEKTGCELPEGWQQVILGDVITINDATYSSKDKWPFINYLDTGNLTNGEISEIKNFIIGTDKIPSRAKRKIQPGDIVYSTVRPNQKHFGIIKDLPENLLVSTAFVTIRGKKEKADTNFVYFLLTQRETIEILQTIGEHSTSAYPSIKPSDIEALKFNLPPLPEQKAIAHILGSLDDKIELNRRMNETLEAMAQALFKSWFVDFDPVIDNALTAGNPIPDEFKEKAAIRQGLDDERKSLPNDIRRLFPSEFVHTEEMGWIPKGWDIVKLSDLADVTMGQSPPSDTYNDDQVGLPFYQGSTDFGFRFPSIRKFCSAPKRQAKKDDVLLSVRAPVGNLNRAEVQCCIGRGLAAIRSKTGYSSWIFYRCRFLKKYFETFNSEGTVFGSMNGADLRAIKSVHPCKNTLKVYENITAAIDRSIRLRSGEIDSLGELRDTLLPKLLSGEIRVIGFGKSEGG